MNDKIRESVTFSGRVQGVGFRYKLSHLAEHYGVTGWVRNEYDGTVSAEMQGLDAEIDRIIQALAQDRYIRLEEITRRKMPVNPEERSFRIRY